MSSPAVRRPPPFTYREYRLLPDDGKRYELMHGDIFVSPAPSPRHQTVSRRLQFALMQQLEAHGLAEIYDAPIDLILDDENVVQPDLVIVGTDRARSITERGIEAAPHIVAEILSPGSGDRDNHLKKAVYERFAVPEYWVIDPKHGFIVAWRLEDRVYQLRARYDRMSTLTTPDFPSVAIVLADVFR